MSLISPPSFPDNNTGIQEANRIGNNTQKGDTNNIETNAETYRKRCFSLFPKSLLSAAQDRDGEVYRFSFFLQNFFLDLRRSAPKAKGDGGIM